jgi:hypothetical protein
MGDRIVTWAVGTDGRPVVLDRQEKELRLVDLSRGTMQPISRTGGDPLEYQTFGALLVDAADTVAYDDALQRRMRHISPAGAPVRPACRQPPP